MDMVRTGTSTEWVCVTLCEFVAQLPNGLNLEASGVLEAGANYVHNVEFRTTELRKSRDQARTLAVQAAREKATALAGDLDQGLGEPLTITEEQSSWRSWYGHGWGSRSGQSMSQNIVVESGSSTLGAEATVAPGQITVDARVSVSFALE